MAATVKGSVVTAAYEHLKQAHGEEVWFETLGRLNAEDLALVKSSARTLQFPVATDGRVMATFVAVRFGDDRVQTEAELRRGGASQADHMLAGVFSVFARLASPRQAFLRAGSIITSVYTGVTHVTEEATDGGGGTLHLIGLGESDYVAPWQCGWMERALIHFGSTAPRVTERNWAAGSQAADELIYDIRF